MTYFQRTVFVFFIIMYVEKILWCIVINGAVPSRDLGVFYLLNFVSIHPYVFACKKMKCMILMSLLQEKTGTELSVQPAPTIFCIWEPVFLTFKTR